MNSRRSATAVGYLLFAIAALLVFRFWLIIGVPEWGWDEGLYVSDAKAILKGETPTMAEPLYAFIITPAVSLTDDYLTGIKLINLVLFSLGVLSIYGVSRLFFSRVLSLVICICTLCIGQMSIASHAMTEPAIFFFYWAVLLTGALFLKTVFAPAGSEHSSAMLQRLREHSVAPAAVAALAGIAMAFGAATSPKLHYIYVAWSIIAIGAYGHILRRQKKPLWRLAWAGGAGLTAFLIVSATIACMVPHASDGFYSGLSDQVTVGNFLRLFAESPGIVFNNIVGHAGTTFLPYAMGFGAALLVIYRERISFKSAVLVLCLIGVALSFAMTLLFTITWGEVTGISNTLFGRYYFYSLPFMLLTPFLIDVPDKGARVFTAVLIVLCVLADWYTVYQGTSSVSLFGGIENAELWQRAYSGLHHWMLIGYLILSGVIVYNWNFGRWLFLGLFVLNGLIASFSMVRDLGVNTDKDTACSRLINGVASSDDKTALLTWSRGLMERTILTTPFEFAIINGDLPNGLSSSPEEVKTTIEAKQENYDFVVLQAAPQDVADLLDPVIVLEDCQLFTKGEKLRD